LSGQRVPDARPTILLIGKDGQLGRELAAVLPAHGEVVACGRATLDLADPAAIVKAVRDVAPRLIVNAAAYTAVDDAEAQRDTAFAINARAPGILADEAKRTGAVLIHYSTDYVFDGASTTPYDESAQTRPLGVYGASKLAGERAIAASGALALTLRTSWIYGRHGRNFLTTMERLAATRDELRVVADQAGVPNWSRALAGATARLIAQGTDYLAQRAGLYHLSAQGRATWFEFARAIIGDDARVRVTPITTADYPTPARRPAYAVLDATRFARTFGFVLPDWHTSLRQCLRSAAEPQRSSTVN
jgi:dTDP-4-dehydrorhamnose reductase